MAWPSNCRVSALVGHAHATLHQRVCGATTRGRTLTNFTFDTFKLLFFGIGELWRSGGARPRLPAPARHDVTRDLSEAATAFPPLFSANGTGIRRVAFEAFLPAREYHHPAPWAVPVTWPRGSASQAASHTGMPCGAAQSTFEGCFHLAGTPAQQYHRHHPQDWACRI